VKTGHFLSAAAGNPRAAAAGSQALRPGAGKPAPQKIGKLPPLSLVERADGRELKQERRAGMQNVFRKRARFGWAMALLLLAAGFIAGITVAGGGNGRIAASVPAILSTSEAVAAAPGQMEIRSYADVASIAMPAVVNISSTKVVDRSVMMHPWFDDPFFRRFFGVPRDDGRERIERSLGSGIVVSSDGYILTNNHVIEKAKDILVSFQNNEEHKAEVIGADPRTDVALLKIEAKDLPYIRFDVADDLRVGDQVMAIGNPFGLGQTVTLGIVSAVGRSIGLIDYEDLIQTDATINPGNSGGALVNMNGQLIGMNTAILSRSGGSQGIGFAIPADMARHVMESLRDSGKVERAWLGVMIQNVDQSMAEYHGLDKPQGVLISNVNKDTPAEKAGLQEGDIILAVDGETVNSMNSLRNKISLSPIGHKAKLSIWRDNKQRDVTVELAALPEDEQVVMGRSGDREIDEGIDGVTVAQLSPERRRMAEIPDDIDGVIVTDVDPASNAAREGLSRGDVIMEIAREPVKDLDDYQELVGKDTSKPILLRVFDQRGGRIFMAIPR
jgi:serine protease Do